MMIYKVVTNRNPLTILARLTAIVLFLTILCAGSSARVWADGGPGGVDGSNLKLWLKANVGVGKDGNNNVVTWVGQSSNNKFFFSVADPKPKWVSSTINTYPVVRFSGTEGLFYAGDDADFESGSWTIFSVYKLSNLTSPETLLAKRNSDGSGAVPIRLYMLYDGYGKGISFATKDSAETTSIAIFSRYAPSDEFFIIAAQTAFNSYMKGYLNGKKEVDKLASAQINDFAGDGYLTLGSEWNGGTDNLLRFTGDIAELIVYVEEPAINETERTHIELYLMNKYNIDLRGTGLYASNTHTKNVRGVSKSANVTASGISAGFSVNNITFLQDNDDVITLGHNSDSNGETTANLPAGIASRWLREWYVDVNDAAETSGGEVVLVFDFRKADIIGTPTGNYVLLRRGTSGGVFSVVSNDFTIVDDKLVRFTIDVGVKLTDGFYTLGKPSVPTISGEYFSDPTQTTARLNALVNPHWVSNTEVTFQWGTSTSYGNDVPAVESPLSGVGANVAVHANISGVSVGQTYHWRVVATGEGNTTGDDNTLVLGAPSVETLNATNLARDSATLAARVNSQGAPLVNEEVLFLWGAASDKLNNQISVSFTYSDTTFHQVNKSISGLTVNKTYYYQAQATSAVGTAKGAVKSFTTLPYEAEATTLPATNIGLSSATLNGAVNPQGDDTHVTFRWSTTKGGPYNNIVDMGTFNQIGFVNINGILNDPAIQPHTPYYYVISSTNRGGTSIGDEQNFTTGVEAATGRGTVAFYTEGAEIVTNLQALSLKAAQAECGDTKLPEEYEFYYGFFNFDIIDVTPGGTVDLEIEFPSNIPRWEEAVYFKCVKQGNRWRWKTLPVSKGEGSNILVAFEDGNANSDADLMVNGIICDPGALGIVPLSIPTLSEWGLIFFIGTLGAYAVTRLRRR